MMTEDEFKKTAKRTEDDTSVTYDLRPFGDQQQEAGALYLGSLIFKSSISSVNTSKKVVLLADSRFEMTDQLDGFVEKMKAKGLSIEIRPALTIGQQLTRAVELAKKRQLTNPRALVRFNEPKEVVEKPIGDEVDFRALEVEITQEHGYIEGVVGDQKGSKNAIFPLP
jgi:hypothetical protein